MSLGNNINFLRKQKRLTQEQLADQMNVTRQTVSRWESDEVVPELNKLVEMCSVFSCKLDELVRENMSSKDEVYSEVQIRKVPAFRMARYVIISPSPESDVQNYMKKRGKISGLLAADANAKLIGWDFPFVSQELQANNFKDKLYDDILCCFEHEYEKDGVSYMDIYVHVDSVTKVDAWTAFN